MNKHIMKCTIHQIEFTVEHRQDYVPDCPYCLLDAAEILKAECDKLRTERDSLLAAIKVKFTHDVLDGEIDHD